MCIRSLTCSGSPCICSGLHSVAQILAVAVTAPCLFRLASSLYWAPTPFGLTRSETAPISLICYSKRQLCVASECHILRNLGRVTRPQARSLAVSFLHSIWPFVRSDVVLVDYVAVHWCRHTVIGALFETSSQGKKKVCTFPIQEDRRLLYFNDIFTHFLFLVLELRKNKRNGQKLSDQFV